MSRRSVLGSSGQLDAAGLRAVPGGHHTHVSRQLPVVVGGARGYEFVAEALFGRTDVDGFFVEFHDERSGSFTPTAVRARWRSTSSFGLVPKMPTNVPRLRDPTYFRRT